MGTLTIAFNTFREAARSKAFYVLVLAGVILLLLWVLMPFFTQGNELGMLKEMDLSTMTVLGVLMGILVAGTVVTSELGDRTAMTLLSKPITRPQFVLGKFVGVLLTVLSAMVVMGLVVLLSVWLKALMELKPGGGADRAAAMAKLAGDRWRHVATVLPGLALAMMQVAVMSAVAVALAMRLPLAANAPMVLGLYLLGHLLPRLQEMTAVRSVGRVFLTAVCWVLPNLKHYNVGNAIAFGHPVPWKTYVLPALGYTVLYGLAALLVAMAMFRERELT